MTPLLDMAKLCKVVITSTDRQEFLGKIQAAQALLFSPAGKTVQEAFPELAVYLEGANDLAGLLEQMHTGLLSLPVIRLTFAFKPDRPFIEKIAETVRLQRGDNPFILEIEMDLYAVAGVMISDGGAVIDKTLKKRLQTVDLKPILQAHVPSLHTL
jgi:hypothetical protein